METQSGRILVPVHHGAYVRDFVLYSDDGAETWKVSKTDFGGMDEPSITQLSNGTVMFNARNTGERTKGRGLAFSDDDGATFGPIIFKSELYGPVCQGSTVTFDGVTLFSNPDSHMGRDHMSVKFSYDNGLTYNKTLLIEKGSSAGYSCLVNGEVSPKMGGLLYESPGSEISFTQFAL